MAVCPHCDKPLTELTVNPMEGKLPVGLAFNCMLFSCPSCQKGIGARVDTSAGQTELRDRLDALTEKSARADPGRVPRRRRAAVQPCAIAIVLIVVKPRSPSKAFSRP